MTKMTDRKLHIAFEKINDGFFDGRIKLDELSFASSKRCLGADGISRQDTILINDSLRDHGDFAIVTLIHEMIHVDIRQRGYVGYAHHEGHHMIFYSEMDRLYRAGVYEGLL